MSVRVWALGTRCSINASHRELCGPLRTSPYSTHFPIPTPLECCLTGASGVDIVLYVVIPDTENRSPFRPLTIYDILLLSIFKCFNTFSLF